MLLAGQIAISPSPRERTHARAWELRDWKHRLPCCARCTGSRGCAWPAAQRGPSARGLGGILDVPGIRGSVPCDVDSGWFCFGFCKVSVARRLGVEASSRQCALRLSLCDEAVTEVPDACHYDGAAIVTMRMRLDTSVRRNSEANRVGARHGWLARDRRTNAMRRMVICAGTP